MPTPVLGSLIFETIPTIQASGVAGGDPVLVADGGTIPAISGGAGAPSGASGYGVGELYVDTTNHVLYINTTGTTWVQFTAGTASVASSSTIAAVATNAAFYPVFVSATSGNLPLNVDTGLTYNPSINSFTLTGTFNVAPNAAAVTPIAFTSGTLNTTPVAGGLEFNGQNLYFSSVASQRAEIQTGYFFRLNGTVAIPDTGTTAISWLGLTTGVTVQANTTYQFEGVFAMVVAGTVTSHSESLGFTVTGATVTNIGFMAERGTSSSTATAGTVMYGTSVTMSATVNVIATAITTANTYVYRMKGTVSFGTGGSFRPDIWFSVAPGAGTRTIQSGAYFRMSPIGASGANVVVGTWT